MSVSAGTDRGRGKWQIVFRADADRK